MLISKQFLVPKFTDAFYRGSNIQFLVLLAATTLRRALLLQYYVSATLLLSYADSIKFVEALAAETTVPLLLETSVKEVLT